MCRVAQSNICMAVSARVKTRWNQSSQRRRRIVMGEVTGAIVSFNWLNALYNLYLFSCHLAWKRAFLKFQFSVGRLKLVSWNIHGRFRTCTVHLWGLEQVLSTSPAFVNLSWALSCGAQISESSPLYMSGTFIFSLPTDSLSDTVSWSNAA